jgi:hypothetical protein
VEAAAPAEPLLDEEETLEKREDRPEGGAEADAVAPPAAGATAADPATAPAPPGTEPEIFAVTTPKKSAQRYMLTKWEIKRIRT